jgi:hypothetical protein
MVDWCADVEVYVYEDGAEWEWFEGDPEGKDASESFALIASYAASDFSSPSSL